MSKRKATPADEGSTSTKTNKTTRKDISSGASSSAQYWRNGLKQAMKDPSLLVKSGEFVVIIRDKFPKAKYHFLIIPKNELADIHCLNSSHVELLQRMEREAFSIIDSHTCGVAPEYFMIGYHAVPSMRPLHLHVISKDFDSPCLKTKKHWNSFTTEFFRKSTDVLQELEQNGNVQIEEARFNSLLTNKLRCHWCSKTQQNIPTLKKHIQSCRENKLKVTDGNV